MAKKKMEYRIIKDSIIKILEDNANNCFRVVGSQGQKHSAEEFKGNNKLVRLFSSDGEFPKGSGAHLGPVDHHVIYKIELTVSAPATGDLKILKNVNASAVERQVALANALEGTAEADNLLDELYDLVFNILMDANNVDMGMGKGNIADRWIADWHKDEPLDSGSLVVLTATTSLTLRTEEEITGIPIVGEGSINSVRIDIDKDDVEQTKITVGE